MRLPTSRVRFILAVATVGAVGVMIFVAMAVGATPKKGSYSYSVINGASGYPLFQVYFSVGGKPGNQKVKDFTFDAGYACGAPVSMGNLSVKSNGKFQGAGHGEDLSGDPYNATVKGKFKSNTTATGTISAPCLSNADFTAKKGGFSVCEPKDGPACPAHRLGREVAPSG